MRGRGSDFDDPNPTPYYTAAPEWTSELQDVEFHDGWWYGTGTSLGSYAPLLARWRTWNDFTNDSWEVLSGLVPGTEPRNAYFLTEWNDRLFFTLWDRSPSSRHDWVVEIDTSTVPALYCFSFDNFCDGIEISDVLPDKTVVGTWRNYNCGGETRPMLGGYSGKNVSPRLSWLTGDRNAFLEVYSYNLNVDARTFDLFKHDTAFNLVQFQDDEPYTVTQGACPFGPEKEGFPASTGIGE